MQKTNKKILIVDDEHFLARTLERKMQKMGYDAFAVFDGPTAILELRSGQYSLLVLDIIMPEMDGWEILVKIKEMDLRVTVVVVSNLCQDEDISRAKELGACDYIIKSNTSLVDIVNRLGDKLLT